MIRHGVERARDKVKTIEELAEILVSLRAGNNKIANSTFAHKPSRPNNRRVKKLIMNYT